MLQLHARRTIALDFDETLFWTNKSWLAVFEQPGWTLDALPQVSRATWAMRSVTTGEGGVVALWSR